MKWGKDYKMKAILNGRILLPDREIKDKALLYDEKIIGLADEKSALMEAEEMIDADGAYVSPGLIDVHVHGYAGTDVSDGCPDGIRRMAHFLLQNGVTGFLPTSLTVGWDRLENICEHIRGLMEESDSSGFSGSQILGMHMEGPFINPAKKGAHNPDYILLPDAEKVLPFADVIRVITYAPEMPGGKEFTGTLLDKTNIALSIGHTNATYEQAMDVIRQGVTRVTHIFNAMTGLHHRDPGVVGAALSTDIYAELIADTFHVKESLFPLMVKIKGDKLVLISDALCSAGMPDGEYENGGQTFILKGNECRLKDGTIAGSVLRLNNAVKNLRNYACLPMYKAVRAASLNAAESVNLDQFKGSLTPGKDADIVLLDDDCQVIRTIVKGTTKYLAYQSKSMIMEGTIGCTGE